LHDGEHSKNDLLALLCITKEPFLYFENGSLELDLSLLDSSVLLFLKQTVGLSAIVVLPACCK